MRELSPEERAEAEAAVQGLRAEGNASFATQQYEDALQKYTVRNNSHIIMLLPSLSLYNAHFADYNRLLLLYQAAVRLCASSGLPPDALVLSNRAATYLALKRYVPAW